MCHCGSPYCEFSSDQEAFEWATTEHYKLMDDPEWVKKYPDSRILEAAVSIFIWQKVKERYPKRFFYRDSYAREYNERLLQTANTGQ